MSILGSVKDIATAPFAGDLDLVHLFLLIGVIIVFIIAWMFVIAHIRGAAMEVVDGVT